MLSDPVAEAFGLIHRHHSGENLLAEFHCVKFAANLLQQDLLKLATWCAKWRIKLNPEKNQGNYLLQVPARQESRTQPDTIWRTTENLLSSEILRHYFRLKTHFPKTL